MKRESVLLPVYILEILKTSADKDTPMIQSKLLEKLGEEPYDLHVTPNTLSAYIEVLKAEGLISGNRGNYAEKTFDDHELRLLIDGVLFGKHIPEKVAENLIDKLKKMSGKKLQNRIRHIRYLPGLLKTDNPTLYEMIDLIDEAIHRGKKIRVVRCKYNLQKTLVPLKDEYVLDPYYLVPDNSRYFLICHMIKNGHDMEGLVNLRVDRIIKIEILNDRPVRDIRSLEEYKQGFNLEDYMQEHIYMFSGKSVIAKMRINNENISDFIDWYGKKFTVLESDELTSLIRFKVNENSLIYWALQYSDKVTILSPPATRNMLIEKVASMARQYDLEKGEFENEKNGTVCRNV